MCMKNKSFCFCFFSDFFQFRSLLINLWNAFCFTTSTSLISENIFFTVAKTISNRNMTSSNSVSNATNESLMSLNDSRIVNFISMILKRFWFNAIYSFFIEFLRLSDNVFFVFLIRSFRRTNVFINFWTNRVEKSICKNIFNNWNIHTVNSWNQKKMKRFHVLIHAVQFFLIQYKFVMPLSKHALHWANQDKYNKKTSSNAFIQNGRIWWFGIIIVINIVFLFFSFNQFQINDWIWCFIAWLRIHDEKINNWKTLNFLIIFQCLDLHGIAI